MKKIILSLFLLMTFSFTFAQKANVRKAKAKLNLEVPDYKGAREAIKLALLDTTTNKLAETWYIAGTVGYKENESPLTQDPEVKGKAILESYNCFLTALKLDSMPDAKGKVKLKYTKDIKAKLKDYFLPQNLVAYGAFLYEKKNWDATTNTFETYLSLPKLPILNNELKVDTIYYKIKYYTALAYLNASKSDNAIVHLKELKDGYYENLSVYKILSDEYNNTKDTVNYESTLEEGFKKFPNDTWFLERLINVYIFSNRSKEAMVYLTAAIKRDPTSAQYWYVKGNLDENMNNLDTAIVSFNKAIELNPKLPEAYAGKGRLLFNKAVKMSEDANDIKDVKTYKAEMKKADAVFKESLPYFLNASELKPKSIDYKETLKTLYYRLKMDAEYEAISKEIKELKGS